MTIYTFIYSENGIQTEAKINANGLANARDVFFCKFPHIESKDVKSITSPSTLKQNLHIVIPSVFSLVGLIFIVYPRMFLPSKIHWNSSFYATRYGQTVISTYIVGAIFLLVGLIKLSAYISASKKHTSNN